MFHNAVSLLVLRSQVDLPSPLLPWEVIERVVDHSSDCIETLRNVALTCRDLRPRASILMVRKAKLLSRDRIFGFCDFIEANLHLQPFVRSTVVDPMDFAPIPLLHLLPNIVELEFTASQQTIHAIHKQHLNCFLGTHIRTLRLSSLSFGTVFPLAEILLAFKNLVRLACTDVVVEAARDSAPLEVMKARLSEQTILQELALEPLTRDASVLYAPLFHACLQLSTVRLVTDLNVLSETIDTFPHLKHWPRLSSLVLRLSSFRWKQIPDAVRIFKRFRGESGLRELEVILEPCGRSIFEIMRELFIYTERSYWSAGCRALDSILGDFYQARVAVACSIGTSMRAGSSSLWIQELGKAFPYLLARNGLTLEGQVKTVAQTLGHDAPVRVLVTSPDSEWVASGSSDSTIILWRTSDGTVAQEWLAHSYEVVRSLAFSPDNRYLVSGGDDRKAAVWDLSLSPPSVTILEGHTETVSTCAWSPDGTLIVTGSWDATVRLWNAHTHQQLHVLQPGPAATLIQCVEFSPNGRWLVSGSSYCNYNIWDVASGIHHKSISNDSVEYRSIVAVAAFDSTSMHVAVTSLRSAGVELWDLNTGGRRGIFEDVGEMHSMSFSPDGRLLLAVLENGMLKVWDAHTGGLVFQLNGYKSGNCIARFSPCGKYVAAASRDATIRFWRISDGSCLATIPTYKGRIDCLAFSLNGNVLVLGDRRGTVVVQHVWDIVPMVQ